MNWLSLVLLLFIMAIVRAVIHFILRKTLKIEQRKGAFFSYNHVNITHKKLGWGLRVISLIVLFALFYYLQNVPSPSFYLFAAVVVVLGAIDILITAFFQWRYSQNPKESVVLMSDLFIMIATLFIVIQFDLLQSIHW